MFVLGLKFQIFDVDSESPCCENEGERVLCVFSCRGKLGHFVTGNLSVLGSNHQAQEYSVENLAVFLHFKHVSGFQRGLKLRFSSQFCDHQSSGFALGLAFANRRAVEGGDLLQHGRLQVKLPLARLPSAGFLHHVVHEAGFLGLNNN